MSEVSPVLTGLGCVTNGFASLAGFAGERDSSGVFEGLSCSWGWFCVIDIFAGDLARNGILVDSEGSSWELEASLILAIGFDGERDSSGLAGASASVTSVLVYDSNPLDGDLARRGVEGFCCSDMAVARADLDGERDREGIIDVLLLLILACLASDAAVGVVALRCGFEL